MTDWARIAAEVRENWPVNRARFCRDMDPERFLADIHGYGWDADMLAELQREVRARATARPDVPIVEHMLDAAIAVRYPTESTP
jgi:hypothetical protein